LYHASGHSLLFLVVPLDISWTAANNFAYFLFCLWIFFSFYLYGFFYRTKKEKEDICLSIPWAAGLPVLFRTLVAT